MSKNLLIFLGGTGQAVAHYYVQRYLLGNLRALNTNSSPFHIHVVDTDAIYGSLNRFKNFLADARYGKEETDGMEMKLPKFTDMKFEGKASDLVVKTLTGIPSVDDAKNKIATAYFDKESLAQNVREGLYARPSLASVVFNKNIKDKLPSNILERDSRVIIVSSLIGGTGGGVTAPLLDVMRVVAEELNILSTVKFYGVFYGKYFEPDTTKLKNAEQRFSSNRDLVLKSIEEAFPHLNRYFLIEPSNRLRRPIDDESKGEFLAWPDDRNHYLWQGTRAVEYFRSETIAENVTRFSEKKIDIEVLNGDGFDLKGLSQKRDFRVAYIDTLINQKVIERLSLDGMAKSVWGQEMVSFVDHYNNLAINAMGGVKRAKDFPSKVQTQLKLIWQGGNTSGMRSLFPSLSGKKPIKVEPQDIQRLKWPPPSESHRRELSSNMETASKVLAGSLLLYLLYQQ